MDELRYSPWLFQYTYIYENFDFSFYIVFDYLYYITLKKYNTHITVLNTQFSAKLTNLYVKRVDCQNSLSLQFKFIIRILYIYIKRLPTYYKIK